MANIDEIFTILVDNLTVNISIQDQSNLYSIDFGSQTELDSFVTCLAGYYRFVPTNLKLKSLTLKRFPLLLD